MLLASTLANLSFSLTDVLAQTQTIQTSSSGGEAAAGLFGLLFCCVFSLVGIALFGLWIWMLIDCCQRNFPGENDKVVWILVIVLASWLGALIYFFVGRPKGTKA